MGYSSGETITINVSEPYNNEFKAHTFEVSGFYHNEDISLEVRDTAVNVTGYSPPSILHSVGKKPITIDNPLPITDRTDLLKEYALSGGDDENRIYGYVNKKGAWYIQKYSDSDKTYKYVKGSSDFSVNWGNRTSLDYDFFNKVFG